MAIQVKIKNQAETTTVVTLDKNTPHIQLQTRQKYVPENIAIELEGADQSDATAVVSDILSGKTAYNGDGKVTGTMPNNGDVSATITTQGGTATIPSGYTSGGTVTAQISATVLDNTIISGTAFEEATGDYAWKSTVNVPAGYHNAQTLEKIFSDVFPAPSTEGTATELRLGYQLYNHKGQLVTGTMAEKSAATYSVSATDQVISSSQYLAGDQTIKAVVVSGVDASKMLATATVTVGDATSPTSITNVTGTIQDYAGEIQIV